METKAQILAVFDAHDLGEATCFLGMDIHRNREARTISLAQSRLTADLLERYNMAECKSLTVPLNSAIKLTNDGELLDTSTYSYRQLVGSSMYLSVCTRPDIAQAVGALARHMAAPTVTHWQAAKGLLRYIAGTSNYGITFGGNSLNLQAYCDADYAGDIDTRPREVMRSHPSSCATSCRTPVSQGTSLATRLVPKATSSCWTMGASLSVEM
jgi:hypothetical protein